MYAYSKRLLTSSFLSLTKINSEFYSHLTTEFCSEVERNSKQVS